VLQRAAQGLALSRWKFYFLEGKDGFVSSVKTVPCAMAFCSNNRKWITYEMMLEEKEEVLFKLESGGRGYIIPDENMASKLISIITGQVTSLTRRRQDTTLQHRDHRPTTELNRDVQR
jgi:hypothetical protein